jgi:hypothetical protein
LVLRNKLARSHVGISNGGNSLSLNLLLLATTVGVLVVLLEFLFVLLVVLSSVSRCRDPKPRLTVTSHAGVLVGKIKTRAHLLATTLGKLTGAGAHLGADSSVGLYPVGKSIFTVLNNAVSYISVFAQRVCMIKGKTYDLLAS